ncbi:Spo12 family protein [Schizosaccharomyces cryophilus OY26]|uniref:Spo12 family protein n=1 Tax=Schizosaccharomyces cryophilus (strain OY26 / ATCC MYA-4695 / CBS 11777 / NBRC 106824 / NRRL Y48691) TaxID=653667 RepID=S9W5J6_SCHCR|nr:Spo12 family protein [Schizosaccharomyces cryophilus OY26]EPY53255.1 Spo12 family protein [Schizosaccharomyces cryophilus OY26]
MAYVQQTQSKEAPEIMVQPLHQGSKSLRKQILEPRFSREKSKAVTSPTDNLMSPCTAKLQAHKKKYYTKGKPVVTSLKQTLLEARDDN